VSIRADSLPAGPGSATPDHVGGEWVAGDAIRVVHSNCTGEHDQLVGGPSEGLPRLARRCNAGASS